MWVHKKPLGYKTDQAYLFQIFGVRFIILYVISVHMYFLCICLVHGIRDLSSYWVNLNKDFCVNIDASLPMESSGRFEICSAACAYVRM